MKLSKKAYRDKQNQATGSLVLAGIAFLMLCFKVYGILFNSKEPRWEDIIWVLMIVVGVVTWRIRENKLKNFEVED